MPSVSKLQFVRYTLPIAEREIGTPGPTIPDIFKSAAQKLTARGYLSLELSLKGAMSTFFCAEPDLQSLINSLRAEDEYDLAGQGPPPWFVELFKSPSGDIIALDFESIRVPPASPTARRRIAIHAEIDVFCFHGNPDHLARDGEDVREALDSMSPLVVERGFDNERRIFDTVRRAVVAADPNGDPMGAETMSNPRNRALLGALKARQSVLGADLGTLLPDTDGPAVARAFAEVNGTAPGLVETKIALVCTRTHELLSFLSEKGRTPALSVVECPHCGSKLSDETVETMYRPGESLKSLLDGAKWLPLLAKQTLVAGGALPEEVLINCMADKDEIDLIAFAHGEMLVGEFKARPVNLGDVYRFAAKISHFKGNLSRHLLERESAERISRASRFLGYRTDPDEAVIIPLIVTTHDVEADALTFLKETLPKSIIISRADECMRDHLSTHLEELKEKRAIEFYHGATGFAHRDSSARLAGYILQAAADARVRGSTPPDAGAEALTGPPPM